ncbi:HD-GYP domain-containing protein [Halalkalibacter nanhaiisediminis]|uniref:Putative nucleotidyltransferase with HDIG domain n=1 Tax=Halalkalibacter nanhaiisediminis TaxID=688079 RepID=A0A562QGJ5_9BACI|nr:HD domain-containing phosphohydrolase [Halalkalibacter nanhaiisediminis]TWI55865.1 putative nucleotidyltransferase with HDIG domain [Halalkalibacter nanhaiisediminis]
MRYTLIDNVQQGERLGKHIFASDGRILLQSGAQLTVGILSRLRHMGVQAIYIKDERVEDIEVEEVVSESVKRSTIATLKDSFHFVQSGKNIDFQSIQKSITSIIDEVLMNHQTLLSLTDIRTEDNELFIHSVNVCIISTILGVKVGLDRTKLQELATGALLHDIGKILPSEKGKEDDVENDHTWKGFNALRKNKEISTLSAHIALTHHEHIDGSGYPRQLKDEEIHYLSKVVAIANTYDRLISKGEDNRGLYPHEACEHLLALTNVQFSHPIMWRFLRAVAFYPTGSQVKLSTNETGIVVGQHTGLPQRPIIRVFEMTGSDSGDYDVKHIDLAKETTVFIEKVLM